jgi:alpha-glucosidase
MEGNNLSPATPLVLDVFPSAVRVASFVAYDDDGHTYAYEKGEYFRQEIAAKRTETSTGIALNAATGSYHAPFSNYLLRVHQASGIVTSDGKTLKKFDSETVFLAAREAGWFATADKFGPVTEVRLPSDAQPHALNLSVR